jgi:hypothetical protein
MKRLKTDPSLQETILNSISTETVQSLPTSFSTSDPRIVYTKKYLVWEAKEER